MRREPAITSDAFTALAVGAQVEVRHWEFSRGWHSAEVADVNDSYGYRMVTVRVDEKTDRTRRAGEGRYLSFCDDDCDRVNIREASA